MSDDLLQEYRAKKLEEEHFERSTFPRPCELTLKHGKARTTYWGKPEVVAESSKEIDGQRLTMLTVLWKTKKDMPAMFTLLLPAGKGLESVMTPCQYMETDKGYKSVMSIVISGLVLLNIVNFWMAMTMTEIGTDAFASPFFLVPLSVVIGAVVASIRFNQTHFTHRLAVECYEADKELGMAHLVYAVDCDMPVHRQLSFVNFPDLLKSSLARHQEVLNEHLLDMRGIIGQKNAEIDSIIRDRDHEFVLQANRAPVGNQKVDIWGNPVVVVLGVVTIICIAALVWVLSGGQ